MTELEFEKLFKHNFPSLCNVAYAVVKDHDQATDIVQQVFIKFWDKRFSVDIDDNIKSYLKRAVVNTSINHYERAKKLKLEDDMQSMQWQVESNDNNREQNIQEIERAVRQAVEKLPDKCQTVFSLSRYEGMTNQEIAEYLEVSVKAVEKHISKALKDLRVELKPFLKLLQFLIVIKVGLTAFSLFLV